MLLVIDDLLLLGCTGLAGAVDRIALAVHLLRVVVDNGPGT